MKIESILTIIAGMSNTLQIIKDHPQLKDLQVSEFYSTPNDLTFGDIELAVEEVLDGLIRAKSEIENVDRLLAPQIEKSRFNQELENREDK